MDKTHLQWIEGRQKQLNSYLKELTSIGLSDNEERFSSLKEASQKITGIYEETYHELPFRHLYSSLHEFINGLSDEELDVMMENMTKMLDISTESPQYPNLIKLYDHLNIEIPRKTQYSIIEQKNKKLISELSKSQESLDNLKKEYSNYSMRLVTVLGMFTAIVLAFTGGMGFLSGSISGIENIDFFKLIFFILLCGFILYNLLLLLLSVVEHVAGFGLLAKEKSYRHMVITVNAVILLSMLLSGLTYICSHYAQ